MGIFERLFGPPNIKKLRERGDVYALIKILKHKDPDIQHQAVVALGQLGDPVALEPLFERAIHTQNKSVQRSTAKALRKIGGPDTDLELRRRIKADREKYFQRNCPRCGGILRWHPGGNTKDLYPSWGETGPGSNVPAAWVCGNCGYRSEGRFFGRGVIRVGS